MAERTPATSIVMESVGSPVAHARSTSCRLKWNVNRLPSANSHTNSVGCESKLWSAKPASRHSLPKRHGPTLPMIVTTGPSGGKVGVAWTVVGAALGAPVVGADVVAGVGGAPVVGTTIVGASEAIVKTTVVVAATIVVVGATVVAGTNVVMVVVAD